MNCLVRLCLIKSGYIQHKNLAGCRMVLTCFLQSEEYFNMLENGTEQGIEAKPALLSLPFLLGNGSYAKMKRIRVGQH